MTDERMALIELIEQDADSDLVREMLSFAAERLMEAEVEARTGAGHGLRDPARQVQRNGYRERAWDTRAGRIDLEIPPLRKGSYFHLWIDATYVKAREAGRIVSTATIIAVGVNTDGRREVLGVATGPSEAETFWKRCCAGWPTAACVASSWSSPTTTRACVRRHRRCSMPPCSGVASTGCATRWRMSLPSSVRR